MGYTETKAFLSYLLGNYFTDFLTQFLLYGNYSKNLLIENGFNSKSLFVINNSLNTDLQNELYLKYINNVLPLGDELFSESDFVLLFLVDLNRERKLIC